MNCYILFVFLILVVFKNNLVISINVKEVHSGELAILECPSNDEKHRFQYWQLKNDAIVGPGNDFNQDKYKYEVWTGKLFIKGASSSETGIYKCISKELNGQAMSVGSVELLVNEDWETVWETDHETNVYRSILGILIFLILLLLGAFAFLFMRRKGRGFSSMQDDSQRGTPVRNIGIGSGAYNDTAVPYSSRLGGRISPTSQAMDAVVIDTDVKSSFQLGDY